MQTNFNIITRVTSLILSFFLHVFHLIFYKLYKINFNCVCIKQELLKQKRNINYPLSTCESHIPIQLISFRDKTESSQLLASYTLSKLELRSKKLIRFQFISIFQWCQRYGVLKGVVFYLGRATDSFIS